MQEALIQATNGPARRAALAAALLSAALSLLPAVILGANEPVYAGATAAYTDMANSPWQTRLFPGHKEFVFTLYGTPGEVEPLRQVVQVMRDRGLGNGFDPGPAPRASSKPLFDYLATVGWPVMCYPGCADMQIKGGSCVLGPEEREVLGVMDRAGIFTTVQLGEWGYYFHNLSPNEPWWHDVYGADFAKFKHLMKPPGLAGYDRRPTSKQECYDMLKDYFASRSHDMLDRLISVTGHSHYEAYAGEWGARCVGLELGENIAFTQSKLAFARGAARQWESHGRSRSVPGSAGRAPPAARSARKGTTPAAWRPAIR